jgi:hypothetical protein
MLSAVVEVELLETRLRETDPCRRQRGKGRDVDPGSRSPRATGFDFHLIDTIFAS